MMSKRRSPDGCMRLKTPETIQYLRLINELMGKNASIPGGREMIGGTALSSWFTKMVKCTPIRSVEARKRY